MRYFHTVQSNLFLLENPLYGALHLQLIIC